MKRIRRRFLIHGPTTVFLSLSAAVLGRAQMPLPPLPGEPSGVQPVSAVEIPPPILPPGMAAHSHQKGPVQRFAHHVGFTIKDKLIGYPDQFIQPPHGYNVGTLMAAQAARAGQHRFTLYRSDFLSGTDQLTPTGAARLTRMTALWQGWCGPILIEADPERPGLAEMRRDTILASLQQHGMPIEPDRLLVGRSPYAGLRGDLAGGASVITGYDGIVISRSYAAPTDLPLPPNQSAATIADATAGGGGQ